MAGASEGGAAPARPRKTELVVHGATPTASLLATERSFTELSAGRIGPHRDELTPGFCSSLDAP